MKFEFPYAAFYSTVNGICFLLLTIQVVWLMLTTSSYRNFVFFFCSRKSRKGVEYGFELIKGRSSQGQAV